MTMPDANVAVKISDPISQMVESGCQVVVAIIHASAKNRETMSPAAKDEQDRINAQIYWDWRDLLKAAGIVGEPRPWPPTGGTHG